MSEERWIWLCRAESLSVHWLGAVSGNTTFSSAHFPAASRRAAPPFLPLEDSVRGILFYFFNPRDLKNGVKAVLTTRFRIAAFRLFLHSRQNLQVSRA